MTRLLHNLDFWNFPTKNSTEIFLDNIFFWKYVMSKSPPFKKSNANKKVKHGYAKTFILKVVKCSNYFFTVRYLAYTKWMFSTIFKRKISTLNMFMKFTEGFLDSFEKKYNSKHEEQIQLKSVWNILTKLHVLSRYFFFSNASRTFR